MVKIFAERKVTTLVHGNKAKLKRLSLALKRCKSIFQIFEIGLIAVQIVLALLPCTSVADFELQWGWGITGQRITGQSCPDWLKMT